MPVAYRMDPGLFDASEQITKLREVFSSIIVGYRNTNARSTIVFTRTRMMYVWLCACRGANFETPLCGPEYITNRNKIIS
jgi:hypothetical protein